MSKPEKTHNQLYDDLNTISDIALDHLGPVHVIATGLDFFLTQAYKSAPSSEEAEILINASVKRAKEENNG